MVRQSWSKRVWLRLLIPFFALAQLLFAFPHQSLAEAQGLQVVLRHPYQPGNNNATLQGVAYGAGKFVAVGNRGVILISNDGYSWEARSSGTASDWYDVEYGDEGFVAVGQDGAVGYSADGERWESDRISTWHLYFVTYKNGRYFATNDLHEAAVSEDGRKWTVYHNKTDVQKVVPPETFTQHTWDTVKIYKYSGGYIGAGDRIILTSSDGNKFDAEYTPDFFRDIAQGGGRLLILGNPEYGSPDFGPFVYSLQDGVNWKKYKISRDANRLTDIAFGSNQFIAVGDYGLIYGSADGVEWTARTSRLTQENLLDIAYAQGRFVAVGHSGVVMTSADGVEWEIQTLPEKDSSSYVTYVHDRFFIITYKGYVYSSLDGIHWKWLLEAQDTWGGLSRRAEEIDYQAGRFWITGSFLAFSFDGVTWEKVTDRAYYEATVVDGVAYLLWSGNEAVSSTDGRTWRATDTYWRRCSRAGVFYILPQDGTSGDGTSWTTMARCKPGNAIETIDEIAQGPNSYLGIYTHYSSFNELFSSAIGDNWSSTYYSDAQLSAIAYGHGRFIAVGSGGTILDVYEPCGAFHDLATESYECKAVALLQSTGAVGGYPDKTFKPGRPVTRAEFSKMLLKTLGGAPSPGRSLPYKDAADHWVAKQGYLQGLLDRKLINGFPDGSFKPDQRLTRAEVVKLTVSAAGFAPTGSASYPDIRATDWFGPWVARAWASKLIGPDAPYPLWAEPRFDAEQPVTRADAAIILANLAEIARRK